MEVGSLQLCEDLLLLMRRIKTSLFDLAEQHQLTPVQLGALYAIVQGETTMSDVAHRLHCDASNVTGIVDRLMAQNLVMRHEGEQDRRTKELRLTVKGQRVMDSVITQLPTLIGCDTLTAVERKALHDAITKLCA